MIRLGSVLEKNDCYSAKVFLDDQQIGSFEKSEENEIRINLNTVLTLNETIELLKLVNGVRADFFQLPIEFIDIR